MPPTCAVVSIATSRNGVSLCIARGENTEKSYFDAIRRSRSSALVEVKIVPGAGTPHTIARQAVDRAKHEELASSSRGKKDSFEEYDEVWAVFDRDTHPRFEEAIKLCEQHGVKIGRSDPCFELWLILHEQDYDKLGDGREVQKELGKLRPDYDPKGSKTPDCDEMVQRVEDAEGRAEAQLQRRKSEGAECDRPSTTVGRLTRAIRGADKRSRP